MFSLQPLLPRWRLCGLRVHVLKGGEAERSKPGSGNVEIGVLEITAFAHRAVSVIFFGRHSLMKKRGGSKASKVLICGIGSVLRVGDAVKMVWQRTEEAVRPR